jgi:hypothetical protein
MVNLSPIFFVGYLTTPLQYRDYIASGGVVMDELERTWKEPAVAYRGIIPASDENHETPQSV